MRTSSNSTPCATSQREASRLSLARLFRVIASSGVPNVVPERVFTSQTTITCRSAATMSISPSAHRQLRSNTRRPARSKYSAATCSPSRPSSSLAFTGHHLHIDSAGGWQVTAERLCGLWTNTPSVDGTTRFVGTGCSTGRGIVCRDFSPRVSRPLLGIGDLEVTLRKLFRVDVLERHGLEVLHETGGPV